MGNLTPEADVESLAWETARGVERGRINLGRYILWLKHDIGIYQEVDSDTTSTPSPTDR